MENRFKRLRYKDDLCIHRKYTMDELADKLLISKATISHLESSEDYDARVSILKRYKEVFPDISYDYMLGAKNTMNKEYSHIEEELPFNNDFYENLSQLFTYEVDNEIGDAQRGEIHNFEEHVNTVLQYMIIGFLNNPEKLRVYLYNIYQSLLDIYILQHPFKPIHTYETEKNMNQEWFNITQTTINMLKETVFPLLFNVFEQDRQEAILKQKKYDDEMKEINKQHGINGLPFD